MFVAIALAATSAHAGTASAPCEILMPEDVASGGFVPTLWPDGVVPYEFDDNVNGINQLKVLDAMAVLEAAADVEFVAHTDENNWVHIQDANSNSSFVGMIGGMQVLNMTSWGSSGDGGVNYIIVHELIHALGLWHEQSRPDRDQFVQINWQNIQSGTEHNFDIENWPIATQTPYDFLSVMHYGQCAFTECQFCNPGCETITVLPPNEKWQDQIGQNDFLSVVDSLELTEMYGPVQIAVPDDFSTIQAAIDAAGNANEIIVEPGTYQETIDFAGKTITLRSTDGPEATVIDAQGKGPAVTFNGNEGEGTVLNGFTITGGDASVGGGVFVFQSSPTIKNCAIEGNIAELNGGGMYARVDSHPTLINCTFANNAAGNNGGGLYNDDNSNPFIGACVFQNNVAQNAGGAVYNDQSAPTIIGTAFCANAPDHIAGSDWDDAGSNCFIDRCSDNNGNGFPDACECPDLAGGPGVDVSDLLALLSAWGPCDNCQADLNNDDQVNVADLLALLAAWGPCS